ncbi:hypothetical protein SUGI_0918760 [Cryptomeria japonica]|nr:hypothetical protein SUGI_0918760 [Cryptomeria japonica]
MLLATVYGSLVYSTWKTARMSLYTSVLFVMAFGLLAMVALLSITLSAMMLTQITILAFASNPRDLSRFVMKGNDVWRCDYLTVYTHKSVSHSQGFIAQFR